MVSVACTGVMLLLILCHNSSSVFQVSGCIDWVAFACSIGEVGIMTDGNIDPKLGGVAKGA